MSIIMADSNVYETIVSNDEDLNGELCLADNSNALMFIPKIERNVEEVMDNVKNYEEAEEIINGKSDILKDAYNCIEQPQIYYDENFSACQEIEVDYKPPLTTTIIDNDKSQDNWQENNQLDADTMDTSLNENPVNTSFHEESENVEDSDEEETIATFLTSAGQRLALYAVEDSDEVFAVAVYDETGDPPTNFQFLMKSDVERLIGEGAVRTVKKPAQIKKQTVNTESEFSVPVQNVEQKTFGAETQPKPHIIATTTVYQNDQCDDTNHTISIDYDTNSSSTKIRTKAARKTNPLPDVISKHPEDFTFVAVEDTAASTLDEIAVKDDVEIANRVELNRSDEFLEESTVQYMLFDDDSDGDLTLADVEETLKNIRFTERSLSKKPEIENNVVMTEDSQNLNVLLINDTTPDEQQPNVVTISKIAKQENPKNIDIISCNKKPYKNPKPPRKIWNSLICRRDDRFKVSSGTSLLISNTETKNPPSAQLPSVTTSETLQLIRPRVKRSRKQQLTSVNRDDTEIIIQPASFPTSEDEEPTRKRGRGRRKSTRTTTTTYKTKSVAKKKITKIARRLRKVEIIEIDVDEGDRLHEKNSIVEITLDENKEKGSSDKENEVIMVGDSDDELQEEEEKKKAASSNKTISSTVLLTCVHCSRSFRQKRALITHSRICPKSPNNVQRINAKTASRRNNSINNNTTSTNNSTAAKKEYACKICQEKFDVVVALARHVRAMHSQKKKVNSVTHTPIKTPVKKSKIKDTKRKSSSDESTTLSPRRKIRAKINASNRSWKTKKLHCSDCGKWFTSDALLTAHSLQHATKKSEKQTRRCQTCKKIFKTRLLYIRHMEIHSRAKQLQKKLHHTRQVAGKTIAPRKRGRPRKL